MLSIIRGLFDRKPGTEQVAKLLLRELQRLTPSEQFTLDLEQFLIRRGQGGVIYLSNLYTDYCQAQPAERKEHITRFALVMASMDSDKPATLDEVGPRLLPILRRLGSVDLSRIARGDPSKKLEDTMVWAPFSPTLGAAVAVDSEHAIAQVSPDDLKRWGIGFEQAFEIAVDNLRHKAAPASIEIGPGLYVFNYGDNYDAARIFLPELAWQLPLNGDPVAMVPNRSRLLVCGASDAAALEDMVAKVRQVLREESRPLSAEMFRLRDRTWSPWTPPGQAGALLATLQREEMAVDYNDQREALEKAHDEAGIDVFVAKHQLLQRDADGSLCCPREWTPGCQKPTWYSSSKPRARRRRSSSGLTFRNTRRILSSDCRWPCPDGRCSAIPRVPAYSGCATWPRRWRPRNCVELYDVAASSRICSAEASSTKEPLRLFRRDRRSRRKRFKAFLFAVLKVSNSA